MLQLFTPLPQYFMGHVLSEEKGLFGGTDQSSSGNGGEILWCTSTTQGQQGLKQFVQSL